MNKHFEQTPRNLQKLRKLFSAMSKQFTISQIMDTAYDIQHNKISKDNTHMVFKGQCKLKSKCNILQSNLQTRSHRLLSRVLSKKHSKYIKQGTELSTEHYCTMELLDTIHIKIWHDDENYRRLVPNTLNTGDIMYENAETKSSEQNVIYSKA
eukprot:345994_1